MELNLLLFGITREVVGASQLPYTLPEAATVDALLAQLRNDYPPLQKLTSLLVAVNSEYAEPDQVLHPSDEIALIPPVSGG
ncbi:molybdopterin synthase sulfur carrier subunit [Catalinimonas alkaloidigena]|uniref:Molybdopterin synthase sulfur carrier subunit n=1 Tax=Catalinimonas alkaloidigena TaxID=1075417 RepID=A0A1G9EMR9_9BACT|nr:MoaD/ThiS family protein [Catalinimonas alkaloidigena]SDK77426.1 molybdopterin synthase sulfur carrier subunit [Catalinimonas alkaloidigena]